MTATPTANPAALRSRGYRDARAHDYLSHYANYGGEWVKLGSVYAELGDKIAGAWIAGYLRGGRYFLSPEQVSLDMERYGHVAAWR